MAKKQLTAQQIAGRTLKASAELNYGADLGRFYEAVCAAWETYGERSPYVRCPDSLATAVISGILNGDLYGRGGKQTPEKRHGRILRLALLARIAGIPNPTKRMPFTSFALIRDALDPEDRDRFLEDWSLAMNDFLMSPESCL